MITKKVEEYRIPNSYKQVIKKVLGQTKEIIKDNLLLFIITR